MTVPPFSYYHCYRIQHLQKKTSTTCNILLDLLRCIDSFFIQHHCVYFEQSSFKEVKPAISRFFAIAQQKISFTKGILLLHWIQFIKNPSNVFVFAPGPMAVSNCLQYCYSYVNWTSTQKQTIRGWLCKAMEPDKIWMIFKNSFRTAQ